MRAVYREDGREVEAVRVLMMRKVRVVGLYIILYTHVVALTTRMVARSGI